MSQSALIFSHSISPRLRYIVSFLSHYYGLSFKLISDEDRYRAAKDPCKINYSYHRLDPNEIFIHSHALLFETFVRQVKIECFEKDGHKAFFKAEGEPGFDLFAAVFYLITRYEEYLPHKKDPYERFAHENSLAFKENFLHIPLVNIWLEDFRILLAEKNPEFEKRKTSFSFLPTYDIDMAWSFRNKGFKRNFGGVIRLLVSAKLGKVVHRVKVIRRKRPDPYDAYEWMDELHRKYGLHPIYFFLVAKETGRYDKNIDPSNPELKQLIRSIASKYSIGLHPSWASGHLPSLLTKEKHTLEQIADQPVIASREHYIRLHLPVSYQRLIALGIANDYSMGYGSTNGFRASIASPYYWFDLKRDEATELLVHPFCFMDANAYYEQKLTPDAALQELLKYYEVIQSIHGKMITIWHNSFLGTDDEFAGWREMYERFVSSIVNRQS
jgi:hypothetical protein